MKNNTDYLKNYKYSGNLEIGFDQFRLAFPADTSVRNYKVVWNHRKDRKSNPNWNFTSQVNFNSINNPQYLLGSPTQQNLNNSFNSDIRLDKSFSGLPFRSSLKLSTRQNSIREQIELNSPTFNFNMTQVFPLKNLVKHPKANKGWRQLFTRFGVTYDFEGKNTALFGDTLLTKGQFNDIGDSFKNGFKQSATLKTTAGLFKNTWKLTPSMNYSTVYNFQTSERYIDTSGISQTRLLDASGIGQSLSLNTSVTTALYSYYRFIGKRQPLLRHVLTPNFGYSYIPNLNQPNSIIIPGNETPIEYSPFEQSTYGIGSVRDQSLFHFWYEQHL